MNWFSNVTKLLNQIIATLNVITKDVGSIYKYGLEFSKSLLYIARRLDSIESGLENLRKVSRLREPGLMIFRLVSDGSSGDSVMKGYVAFPKSVAGDVVAGGSRKLQILVNDVALDTQTLAGDSEKSNEIVVARNDKLTLSLSDIDSSGNEGQARTQEVVVVDNLAPPMPGEIAFVVTDDTDTEAV